MIEDQKKETLLEKAKKEFHDEVDNIMDLPLHIYNYVKQLEMKLALMTDYAEILENDKKVFRELLSKTHEENFKLKIRNEQMMKALKWFVEPDRPIGSNAEMIYAFSEMIKPILDE